MKLKRRWQLEHLTLFRYDMLRFLPVQCYLHGLAPLPDKPLRLHTHQWHVGKGENILRGYADVKLLEDWLSRDEKFNGVLSRKGGLR